jgi:hypothetical protein
MAEDLLKDLQDTDTWMQLRRILVNELEHRRNRGNEQASDLLKFLSRSWPQSSAPRQTDILKLKHRLRLVAGQLQDVIKFTEGDT